VTKERRHPSQGDPRHRNDHYENRAAPNWVQGKSVKTNIRVRPGPNGTHYTATRHGPSRSSNVRPPRCRLGRQPPPVMDERGNRESLSKNIVEKAQEYEPRRGRAKADLQALPPIAAQQHDRSPTIISHPPNPWPKWQKRRRHLTGRRIERTAPRRNKRIFLRRSMSFSISRASCPP